MNGKQKDLTRAEALALAQAKWGDSAFAMRIHTDGAVPTVGVARKERGRGWTWREARERAGLIAVETAST